MKSLNINSESCLLRKNSINGAYINGAPIDELIGENLPEGMKEYEDYPVKINIQIEFLGEKDLNISTTGYEVEANKTEEISKKLEG